MKPLSYKSIRTAEIYSHLSDRHLNGLVGHLPGPKMGTLFGTPVVFPGRTMAQVLDEIRNASKTLFSSINPPYPPWAIKGDPKRQAIQKMARCVTKEFS